MGWIGRINDGVANSRVGHWFQLEGSGHPRERPGSRFTTEIRAGIISFFAMAYILAVNSSIVADSGGTCVCDSTPDDPICAANSDYLLCKNEVKRDLVTATAAISALATFFLGALANMPVGISCGMGLNAYLAYDVVGFHGSGPVPYEVAMTAIFVEGLIFFGLTILGLRQWLARAIPRSIKLATGAGIGLFLTLIGLTYSEGIGLITGAVSTPVELAGCSPADKLEDGTCPGSHKMQNPTLWLAIFCGGILTVVLTMFRVKGAILIGIILVSICSWPRGTSITAFPYTPVGDDSFNFFKKVVDFHPITRILAVQKWDISAYSGQFGRALITFLYVDILDCTGTLYSMARFSNLIDEKTQDFEGSATAYLVDSLSITIGAVFGTSPVTAFIESGAGIGEGGRTGITAMMTGFCFFVSIFFAPIFASIPPWATGCVLILIGSMMMQAVVNINWRYMGDAVPAFLTIAIMPFTYSIADGLIAGICSYIVIQVLVWAVETASMGKLTATNKKDKDPWTWRIPGGILPGWLTRLFQGKKDFWRPYADETIDGNVGVNSHEMSPIGRNADWVKPGEPLPHVGRSWFIHSGGIFYLVIMADSDGSISRYVLSESLLLIGLSIAIAIDAASQLTDLEPMTEPFVISTTRATCLALNLVSRLLMQVRYSFRSAVIKKHSASEGLASDNNKMRSQQAHNDTGELGNDGLQSSVISGPNGNNQDMNENNITKRRMGGFHLLKRSS
ncbi:major facilitator superfamily transporter [Fusarium pseudoanthophilum]|uniref:Major facilitator superfamily transporter n=1 Tax=Fusarium pseudoanthophilum TaxID=48495 RepID=A0A8H5PCH5_9HYPO|nr:major facilitator superfamily transporter [Fusarium pseudoanthophilum]